MNMRRQFRLSVHQPVSLASPVKTAECDRLFLQPASSIAVAF